MLTNIIQQQWLSKNESKAYLAVLELGVSPVSRIARKIDERRENTYHILEELEKKWFIRSVIMNKITHYSAISPEELLDIQQWKIKSLMWIMPQLTALWSWGENKPKVSLFDWSEWLKFLYEDTIKKDNLKKRVQSVRDKKQIDRRRIWYWRIIKEIRIGK